MPSCAICHINNPKPSTRITPAKLASWSLSADIAFQVNQRICTKHLDDNKVPTKHLKQKGCNKGLDGNYWVDKSVLIKRGRYNISNKPLSQEQHSLLTTLNTTSQQLKQAQQAIACITQAPVIDIVDERYLSVFMRITRYKSYPHHIHTLLGVPSWSAIQYLTDLVRDQLPNLQLDIAHEDVIAFVLLRLRRGLPHGAITALYNISESRTTELSNIALQLLTPHLLKHITLLSKEQMLSHTPQSLQENYPSAKIYICDDTYIYIQHSDDLGWQHESFSTHKYRNLCKFFIGCAPDGTILTVDGPYFCDSNDEILQTSLDGGVNAWFSPGDVIVVNRGFREAPYQVADGVTVLRPAYLKENPQFSVAERSESIRVSQIRCVVENVNARLKFYKLLANTYPNKAIPHLQCYVLVAAALLNLYYKPLRSSTWRPRQ